MAEVTGLTAARMLAIEAMSVVDGDIVGDDLILTKHDASTINAGNVRGPEGPEGPQGIPGSASGQGSKEAGFPGAPADGDVIVRVDLPGSPIYAYSTENGWEKYGVVTTDAWHVLGVGGAPALQNGASNYDNAAYRKNLIGDTLQFRGIIQTPNGGMPSNTLLFTLPVGWRPATSHRLMAKCNVNPATVLSLWINYANGEVRVDDNGPAIPAGVPVVIYLMGHVPLG